MDSKKSIRVRMRDYRRSLSVSAQVAAGERLCLQLQTLDELEDIASIAMYLANDGEIDVRAYMKSCWQRLVAVYLPVVIEEDGRRLLFAPFTAGTTLLANKFGILEPDIARSELIEGAALDAVLMPLVAFDKSGNRVGMGGGFYDRTFCFDNAGEQAGRDLNRPLLIGVAHQGQMIDRIDAEPWDVALAAVVTDSGIYRVHQD